MKEGFKNEVTHLLRQSFFHGGQISIALAQEQPGLFCRVVVFVSLAPVISKGIRQKSTSGINGTGCDWLFLIWFYAFQLGPSDFVPIRYFPVASNGYDGLVHGVDNDFIHGEYLVDVGVLENVPMTLERETVLPIILDELDADPALNAANDETLWLLVVFVEKDLYASRLHRKE